MVIAKNLFVFPKTLIFLISYFEEKTVLDCDDANCSIFQFPSILWNIYPIPSFCLTHPFTPQKTSPHFPFYHKLLLFFSTYCENLSPEPIVKALETFSISHLWLLIKSHQTALLTPVTASPLIFKNNQPLIIYKIQKINSVLNKKIRRNYSNSKYL